MSPPSWPYAVNLLILVPVGLGALFNGWAVAEGRFPGGAGWRTLAGALWTAILVGSVLGLSRPVVFSLACPSGNSLGHRGNLPAHRDRLPVRIAAEPLVLLSTDLI